MSYDLTVEGRLAYWCKLRTLTSSVVHRRTTRDISLVNGQPELPTFRVEKMLRSVLRFPSRHPTIRFPQANLTFDTTQTCCATRNPDTQKRRRSPKPKRQVELSNDRITLPNYLDWRTVFPPRKLKDRISVSNSQSAVEMAEAFVPKGSKDKVVIEAFPGEK